MTQFKPYIKPGIKGHMAGIGGVSMAPLAEVLHNMGLEITGSDLHESEAVDRLRDLGIKVMIGQRVENITPDIDFLVRTAAVRDENAEIIAARANGIPVFERTEAWGAIMMDYKNALCISGTHGKTTTTSMSTHILIAAHRDPTVMIGGTLPLLETGHRVGSGDTIILESCEYYDSFLSFFPTVAVVLNIEADHLDYFDDLDDIKDSFRQFAALVPQDGYIVANAEDENTMAALAPLGRALLTFGLESGADVYAANIEIAGGGSEFDVIYKGEVFARIKLRVPGMHNIKNALAATASAICLGVGADAVVEGLGSFTGALRRFEFKGRINGADIYDDYAHHPGEIKVLLDAVKLLDYKRAIIVFQPHTYTRTKALFGDFQAELTRADVLYLTDIYAAREQNSVGVSSLELADAIPGSRFVSDFKDLENELRTIALPGDIILTVGAGDIYKVGEALALSDNIIKNS